MKQYNVELNMKQYIFNVELNIKHLPSLKKQQQEMSKESKGK
jgi:hypothetical protein